MWESKRAFYCYIYLSIYLRYGNQTSGTEKKRESRCGGAEDVPAHLDMDSINSVCQRTPSAKTHSCNFLNTQHLRVLLDTLVRPYPIVRSRWEINNRVNLIDNLFPLKLSLGVLKIFLNQSSVQSIGAVSPYVHPFVFGLRRCVMCD